AASVASDHALMEAPLAAVEWGERAIEAADRCGDLELRIMTRNNLALDLCDLFQPDDALPHLREAMRLALDRGTQPGMFREHHAVGYGLAQLRRWNDAVEEFETSADQQRSGEEGDVGELG